MIYYFSPYSLEKNLGKAYNQYMNLLPNDDDWACFIDADACFLTSNYGKQIQDIVNKYPDTGIFTCYTNRVGNLKQCFKGMISEIADMKYHKVTALDLQLNAYDHIEELEDVISGHLMIVQKKTWNEIKFHEEDNKILQIDNLFSKEVILKNKKILLMKGVYVFHYYRLIEGGRTYKQHLL